MGQNCARTWRRGPSPLCGETLETEDLVKAIEFISQQRVKNIAQETSGVIQNENGCEAALRSFHKQLPLERMRSQLESTCAASCFVRRFNLKISWSVAQVLLDAEELTNEDLIP